MGSFCFRACKFASKVTMENRLSAVQDALRMMRDIFRIHRNARRGDYDRNP